MKNEGLKKCPKCDQLIPVARDVHGKQTNMLAPHTQIGDTVQECPGSYHRFKPDPKAPKDQ